MGGVWKIQIDRPSVRNRSEKTCPYGGGLVLAEAGCAEVERRDEVMTIKIEHSAQKSNGYKVIFVGDRASIHVAEDELLNAVAHYFVLPEHQPGSCAICKEIKQKRTK